MPLPRKKKPVVAQIEKAFKTMEAIGAPAPDKDHHRPQEKSAAKVQKLKTAGRPSAVPNRTARYHFVLSEETLNRLNIAFPQELIKRKKDGVLIDKSLLIEAALIDWLIKNGY